MGRVTLLKDYSIASPFTMTDTIQYVMYMVFLTEQMEMM